MELTLDQVRVSLGQRVALDGVSAVLRPGRITVVLGPNGAGKSTLLRAAAGLVSGEGRVLVGARDLAVIAPRERARAIGYLAQDHLVHWDLRVRDLIALGRAPHRSPFAAESAADALAIAAAMSATDTTAFAERRVLALSGGERARVLLARVLAGEPRWLLADEPLASLDPAHQLDLLARLRSVADAGAGVVLVLHDLAQAARIADDVIVLERGRVVATTLDAAVIARVFGVAVAYAGTLPVPTARIGADSAGAPL
ncbi:MAG: ABC transporter ATP-binding protein [Pseudomonadota bacterium]